MAINLRNTNDVTAHGTKILVYGQAGAGKTYLIQSLPNPVILSAEGGLLSISNSNLPFLQIEDMKTLQEAYEWAKDSDEAKQFESIALDSISEIAEVVLSAEKARAKDPRQAYGEMQDQMTKIIRSFRDLPGKHVYFSAKVEKAQDEIGRLLYYPSMPGNKTGQQLPYFFDEVLALQVGRTQEGETQRALLTESDGQWIAKDRSGKLSIWEAPDLGAVINKIKGETPND
jgi:phage nucleotide-binding protein